MDIDHVLELSGRHVRRGYTAAVAIDAGYGFDFYDLYSQVGEVPADERPR
jgi:hypothetical protein